MYVLWAVLVVPDAVGFDVPVYPVKGYSITLPVVQSDVMPQSTVLDETYKVAITRFNERIRVGGMAELSGYQLAEPQTARTGVWCKICFHTVAINGNVLEWFAPNDA